MNTDRVVRGATALALSAVIGLGMAAPVAAAPAPVTTPRPSQPTTTPPRPTTNPVTIEEIRARCEAAISKRLVTLGNDLTRVNGAASMDAGHKKTLAGIIAGDESGLAGLATTIKNESDRDNLKAECHKIVDDYRVYLLLGPQIHITAAADRLDAANTKLAALADKLGAALAHCTADPAVCAAAEQALKDMRVNIAASQHAVSGVAASVLALTPKGYPANQPTLKAGRMSLQTSRTSLTAVRADVTTIMKALKPTPVTPPTPGPVTPPSPVSGGPTATN